MKVVLLTPGTGNFYCGSSIRDWNLACGLHDQGCDVRFVPLYLPMVHDGDSDRAIEAALFAGGINVFLQHKIKLFRNLPRSFLSPLDHPAILRLASRFMGLTRIRDLGTMSLDAYACLDGNQRREWQHLLDWMATQRPDVIVLSNGLLCGLAPAIKQTLKSRPRIVCTLQGEDSFLNSLPEPWKSKCWEAFRACASSVDDLVAVSNFYKHHMADALRIPTSRIETIYPGIDTARYPERSEQPQIPTIGFLAKLCHGKGLASLVEAFILLVKRGRIPGVQLHLAGTATSADNALLQQISNQLRENKLEQRVSIQRNLSFNEKIRFLHGLSVLSVPTTYDEAFGLYTAEAMACGIPVIQPERGAFPEILSLTRAGILTPPNDTSALAIGLEDLLANRSRQAELSRKARTAAVRFFSTGTMTDKFLAMVEKFPSATQSP